MKCGSCQGDHDTVAEVKGCYGIPAEVPAGTQYAISDELEGRLRDVEQNGVLGKPSTRRDRPFRPSPSDVRHREDRESKIEDVTFLRKQVEEGRYAVIGQDGNSIEFYHVDKPKSGKWAGFTFLKQQAGSELHPAKGLDRQIRVLSQIVADPKGCTVRYGIHIGACGICGRPLTNADSRERGIGPVCAEGKGW